MSPNDTLAEDLRQHLALCQGILAVVKRENQSLRNAAQGMEPETHQEQNHFFVTRKDLLSPLGQSLNKIRQHRTNGLRAGAAERTVSPEVADLLRQNQDMIMKIIVLDRENEQVLLRQGLIPPCHLPSAHRQRPHYVANLYRRQRQ